MLSCRWPHLERNLQIGKSRFVDFHEPVGNLSRGHEDRDLTPHQHIRRLLQIVEPARYADNVGVKPAREDPWVLFKLALEHR